MSDADEVSSEIGVETEAELFEEPVAQRALRSYGKIDSQLRGLSNLKPTVQFHRLTAASAGVGSFGQVLSEASSRLVADLDEQLMPVRQLIQDLMSSAVRGAMVDLSPMMERWRSLGSSLSGYLAVHNEIVTSYLAPLQDVVARITSDFRPFLDTISRAEARQLEEELGRYHWWPIPGMPSDFHQAILQLIEGGHSRRINRYYCDWFRWNRYRRLGRMVRRWSENEYFRSRRPIYNQALRAHRQGWYNLTVPALIPLVEGTARDYLQGEHGITERGAKSAIKRALNRNVPADVFREELQQALIRFLTSSTFADTDRGGVLPSGYELNRHGVAHSRHIRYGTEANSLRCFLLLETLYQYISENPDASWI